MNKLTRTSLLLVSAFSAVGCVSMRTDPMTPLASADPLFGPNQAQHEGRFLLGLADTPNPPDGRAPYRVAEAKPQYRKGPIRVDDRYSERQRVADAALSLVGADRIVVGNTAFPEDCSGFVRAVYASRGIDLYRTPRQRRTDNGVRIIHKFTDDREGLHRRVFPRVGDLVFFDRTWDRNGNGRDTDDKLTHVGIVERVDDDGTIHFVHRISGGIVRQRLNLLYPEMHARSGKVINDWLKRGGRDRLSGKLFAGFGTVIR